MQDKWLQWVTQIQSIAQAGLTFAENQYDIDRYQQLRDLTVEILHQYTEVSHEKIRELFANETGYQTPKVDVRAAVIRDNSILLVKEKVDGRWSMPGGWADVNSSVGESAVRECLEEAGAVVIPRRIVALHHANRHNSHPYPYTIYKVIVDCELVEITFTKNTETLDSRFFQIDELPELSAERSSVEQIEMCLEAKKQNLFETVFD
jgi:ADP-ribose pyrophosphatase YjhB (NUDIX family)